MVTVFLVGKAKKVYLSNMPTEEKRSSLVSNPNYKVPKIRFLILDPLCFVLDKNKF